MIDLVTRKRRAEVSSRALPRFPMPSWGDIPLELFVCAAAIFLAAGLELAGAMP